LEKIHENVNLKHRAMIENLHDPQSDQTIRTPGVVWKSDIKRRGASQYIPEPDSCRKFLDNLLNGKKEISGKKATNSLPLAGVRVLEIGQYTTAPLSCRHLASLGAEVLKIEPPSGDAARQWQPSINGQSLFFAMSNSDKKSYAIDLNQAEGVAIFADLLSTADILVENLKPGSLAKRGFNLERIREINPSLIYCAISGFGTDSAYQERPAFDTVIQAMSGMMDANSFEGTPLKAGISTGDFLGGQIGLFSLLSAFRARKVSGFGEFIDISMQDIAAWTTAPLWNPDNGDAKYITHLISCRDGHALIGGTCAELVHANAAKLKDNDLTREELVASLNEEELDCVPVLRVSEAATHEQTIARELIVWCQSEAGDAWPLLGTPLRFSRTRPVVANPIGDAITIDEEVAAQLGIGYYSKNEFHSG
jgi:crotonobetainyl-CoA:carnitine CoA-transferase CaiB-like acyl-CoA transferase